MLFEEFPFLERYSSYMFTFSVNKISLCGLFVSHIFMKTFRIKHDMSFKVF